MVRTFKQKLALIRTHPSLRKKRKRKKKNFKAAIQLNPVSIGFPQQLLVKHSYAESGIFDDATALNANFLRLKLNSLYDPNHSGIGYQSTLFDNLSLIYRHYKVYAVKVELQIMPTVGTNTTDIGCWYTGELNATTNRTLGMASNFAPVNNERVWTTVMGTEANQKVKKTLYYDLRKLENNYMSDPGYEGTTGDPSKPIYMQFGMADFQGSVGVPNIRYRINLTQYAIWNDIHESENYQED